MWHAGSNTLTSLFSFLMALFERIYTTYQVQLVHTHGHQTIGSNDFLSNNLTAYCYFLTLHMVNSQHFTKSIISKFVGHPKELLTDTQKQLPKFRQQNFDAILLCSNILRINKVCRNRLLVEWYLSLKINLTTLFISTSTS